MLNLYLSFLVYFITIVASKLKDWPFNVGLLVVDSRHGICSTISSELFTEVLTFFGQFQQFFGDWRHDYLISGKIRPRNIGSSPRERKVNK